MTAYICPNCSSGKYEKDAEGIHECEVCGWREDWEASIENIERYMDMKE